MDIDTAPAQGLGLAGGCFHGLLTAAPGGQIEGGLLVTGRGGRFSLVSLFTKGPGAWQSEKFAANL